MTDWREAAQVHLDRQNTAYAGPIGSWAERWLPFVCRHGVVRCTHGDEILGRRMRRRVCMVCGRAFRGRRDTEIIVERDEPLVPGASCVTNWADYGTCKVTAPERGG